MFKEKK